MNNKKKFKNKNKIKKSNTRNHNSTTNNKPWLITALSAMILVTVVTVIMAISTSNKSSDSATPTTDSTGTAPTASTQVPDTQTVPVTTQAPTEVTDIQDSEQPSELTDLLAAIGKGYEELRNYGCSQLVTVNSGYTDAHIKFWECTDGKWAESESLACYGFVGSMGTVDNMSEQISGTPRGLYSIGNAFYRNTAPDTGLESFLITEDTYWVDDPNSKYYNMRVVGTDDKDWNSAEHMWEYSAYDYGFVVNYNMNPITKGAGSAIFFHIGSSPTAGCIATSEEMVKSYLSALDTNLSPCILIN